MKSSQIMARLKVIKEAFQKVDPLYPKCDHTIRRIIDPALFLESQTNNLITDTEMTK